MAQEESNDQLAVIRVPADIHQRVKIQSVLHRREIQEIAAEALSEWLDRHSVGIESSLAGGR